jgi:hypothetical protein
MSNAINAAKTAGTEMAARLNQSPIEAQNWNLLDRNDGIPEGDYVELTAEFGECTREMEQAYRAGFNAIFDTSLSTK